MNYDMIPSLIKLREFCKIDNNLTNFKEYSLSLVEPINLYDHWEDLIISSIKSEIENSIYNSIYKNFKSYNLKFLDVRNLTQGSFVCKIEHYLSNQHYKNVIVNPKIGTHISDSRFFKISHITNNNSTLYKIGKFQETDIWINPYIKYDDTKIIFFDDVGCNIQFHKTEIINDGTIAPKILIRYKFDCNTTTDCTVFLIEDDKSDKYLEYLSDVRDKKISEIIN